jgi:hypothetical protein
MSSREAENQQQVKPLETREHIYPNLRLYWTKHRLEGWKQRTGYYVLWWPGFEMEPMSSKQGSI